MCSELTFAIDEHDAHARVGNTSGQQMQLELYKDDGREAQLKIERVWHSTPDKPQKVQPNNDVVGVQAQARAGLGLGLACSSASKVTIKGIAHHAQLALDQAPDDVIC